MVWLLTALTLYSSGKGEESGKGGGQLGGFRVQIHLTDRQADKQNTIFIIKALPN